MYSFSSLNDSGDGSTSDDHDDFDRFHADQLDNDNSDLFHPNQPDDDDFEPL